MSWLLTVVDEEGIDAIIVAGDIFDTGTPPSYARELYHQFIGQLQGSGCTLVVLGGNHDSVSVLNESKALLHYLNSHVIASTYDSEQVFTLRTRSGDVGAVLCAVPFIRPRDVLTSSAGQSGTDKRIALAEAIKTHYASLFAQAKTVQAAQSTAVPIIATGHLTALGVSQSESVRDIYIGTLEGFDATGFPPADYIALGHIHRPQKVAGSEHIRYSGSPIPLSFDELGTQKQVMIAHFEGGELSTLTPKAIPCFQSMQVIKGDLKDIEHQINASEMINAATEEAPVWLCIEVQTQDFLTDLQQRIHTLLDGKPAELLQLKRMRKQATSSLKSTPNMQLSELSVDDVFKARLALERLDSDEAQEHARLNRINVLFAEAVDVINEGNREEIDSHLSAEVKP